MKLLHRHLEMETRLGFVTNKYCIVERRDRDEALAKLDTAISPYETAKNLEEHIKKCHPPLVEESITILPPRIILSDVLTKEFDKEVARIVDDRLRASRFEEVVDELVEQNMKRHTKEHHPSPPSFEDEGAAALALRNHITEYHTPQLNEESGTDSSVWRTSEKEEHLYTLPEYVERLEALLAQGDSVAKTKCPIGIRLVGTVASLKNCKTCLGFMEMPYDLSGPGRWCPCNRSEHALELARGFISRYYRRKELKEYEETERKKKEPQKV